MSKVPGINTKHRVVTEQCRINHGNTIAAKIALKDLEETYLRLLDKRGEDGANYHFVLAVEGVANGQ